MAAGKQFLFIFIPLINIAYFGILQHELNKTAVSEVKAPTVSVA